MSIPVDPLRMILATLIFVTVSRISSYYSFIAALHPGKLLFALAVMYVVLNPESIRIQNLWQSWLPKAVIALGVVACVSVPFAISMGGAGSFMLKFYIKTLIIFGLIVVAIRHPRDLYIFVWAYLLACAFVTYLAVFQSGLVQTSSMYRLASLGISYDPNDVGLVLTTGIPLALAAFENSGRVGKWTCAILVVGIGAALARTGSRGGFLGLIAVGGTMLFFLHRVSLLKRLGLLVMVVGGLMVAVPPGYWNQMQTLTEPTEGYNWDSPYGRKAIAERGVDYFLDHPFTGVGVGQFNRAESQLSELAQRRRTLGMGFMETAPHNSYVQIGAELGVLGVGIFLYIIFGGIFKLVRMRRALPGGWRERGPEHRFVFDLSVYLPYSLVGYSVTTFFLTFAYQDITYMLFALVGGCFLTVKLLEASYYREEQEPSSKETSGALLGSR